MSGIMIVDQTYDRRRVEAWGQELALDPVKALHLALVLINGVPFTGPEAALLTRFRGLAPWERAGVVDELRDALDKELGLVFRRYVAVARDAEGDGE